MSTVEINVLTATCNPSVFKLGSLSQFFRGCSRMSGRQKRQKDKKLTALPHSIHLSSSPKHQFIHFHMTTSMGTTRNSFTSEPELFIIISLSVCTIIYVLQLWIKQCERAKLQMKYKKFMDFKDRAEVF